jgi:hypothetical protein
MRSGDIDMELKYNIRNSKYEIRNLEKRDIGRHGSVSVFPAADGDDNDEVFFRNN